VLWISATVPHTFWYRVVSSGQASFQSVIKGQSSRMCSGVWSERPHSQMTESRRPSFFRCFLRWLLQFLVGRWLLGLFSPVCWCCLSWITKCFFIYST
jgi:hypothetical protein